MDIILQLTVESLLLGAFYAFMSLGFSLSWGVLNIINLAYGSFIVLGSYLSYSLYTILGLDPVLSLPLSFGCGFLLGTLLQRLLLQRLMGYEPFMVLILTFGLDILLSHLLNLIFKADIRSLDVPYAEGSFLLGNVIVPYVKLFVFFLAVLLTAGLFLFLTKTWTGRAIRAVALDREGAQLVGIDPSRIFLVVSGLGTGIALSSGNMYGLLQGFTPFDGGFLTIKAFLVSIIGGLGRVESAFVGGMFLGFMEIFVSFYWGEGWKLFASLVVMTAVLLLRPRGLFGGKYYGET
ncbi:branched-chain amino acid ABC transporter permease [Hydrogenivirga sp. 128-5-R1-1]|uniref:branched-chain amino acid ABC transporter permease n=1 Tax=Hydrogenivirga sp. 128-5-R1-1 TaxID=392423 RepID=UPI00015EF8E6|nr:branched-chain amino acid ABC transporter permease [Hydrogenivirga sp. 128-5-R1-1]EDP75122.1 Putative high-affinity branched-chain amino acid transporter membrane protein [Hydrogenivirga sp. 128-5-R1-1]